MRLSAEFRIKAEGLVCSWIFFIIIRYPRDIRKNAGAGEKRSQMGHTGKTTYVLEDK